MAKSIIITGCSSGIGLRAAEILTARGYRVFATTRKPGDVEMLQQKGYESLRLDVNDSTSINKAVEEVLQRTSGELYGLCNNAGYGQPGAVEDISRDLLRAQFETNVFGMQELTNRVIPVMRKQGYGRIIQISSLLGLVAMPYRGAYNASKFAVEGLTDTLRIELRNTGIFVSLIEPGPIMSQFRANVLNVYRHHVDMDRSVHKKVYEKLIDNTQSIKDELPFTMPPDAVVKKIIHALESRKPRPRYYVTFPTHLLGTLKRILPTRLLDWVLWKGSQSEMRS